MWPPCFQKKSMKLVHIDPNIGIPIQPDGIVIDFQPIFANVRHERGERATQSLPRIGLVVIGPEYRRQQVSTMPLPGHCQIRQERNAFATTDVQRLSIRFYSGMTKEE